MKKKDYLNEISALGTDELKQRGIQIREELMKLRFRKSAGTLDKPHVVRELKRQLSQVWTVLTQKSLMENASGSN